MTESTARTGEPIEYQGQFWTISPSTEKVLLWDIKKSEWAEWDDNSPHTPPSNLALLLERHASGKLPTFDQARQAASEYADGSTFFEIVLPLVMRDRTAMGTLTGDKDRMKTCTISNSLILEEIEEQGWRLIHANYVFQETGAVSRDKFLSSGQTSQVTGAIVGVYLFRRVDDRPEE